MRKSNLILSAAVIGLVSSAAQAAVLYSASEVRTINGAAGPTAEPWAISAGTTGHILFDDAFIVRPANQNSTLSLGTITLNLNQAAGAHATIANIYVAPMLDNYPMHATGNDPIGTSDDAPDVGTPILLGTKHLDPNPGLFSQEIQAVVNQSSTVNLEGYTGYSQKLGFFVGVSFAEDPSESLSTGDDGTHSWELAWTNIDSHPSMLPAVADSPSTYLGGFSQDVAWDYTSNSEFSEFSVVNSISGAPDPNRDDAGFLATAFVMSVNGSVVPEPTSLGLLAAGSLLLLRRKR